ALQGRVTPVLAITSIWWNMRNRLFHISPASVTAMTGQRYFSGAGQLCLFSLGSADHEVRNSLEASHPSSPGTHSRRISGTASTRIAFPLQRPPGRTPQFPSALQQVRFLIAVLSR